MRHFFWKILPGTWLFLNFYCLFYSSIEKLEPHFFLFPTIKVFPKDTSFFSFPHARRRPFRRVIVAIWKDIKGTGAEYAVRAISRIYSAIDTSLCRLKRRCLCGEDISSRHFRDIYRYRWPSSFRIADSFAFEKKARFWKPIGYFFVAYFLCEVLKARLRVIGASTQRVYLFYLEKVSIHFSYF